MSALAPICGHVFPEGRTCHAGLTDHVHEPPPCRNGEDARHHAFTADLLSSRRLVPDYIAGVAGNRAGPETVPE